MSEFSIDFTNCCNGSELIVDSKDCILQASGIFCYHRTTRNRKYSVTHNWLWNIILPLSSKQSALRSPCLMDFILLYHSVISCVNKTVTFVFLTYHYTPCKNRLYTSSKSIAGLWPIRNVCAANRGHLDRVTGVHNSCRNWTKQSMLDRARYINIMTCLFLTIYKAVCTHSIPWPLSHPFNTNNGHLLFRNITQDPAR